MQLRSFQKLSHLTLLLLSAGCGRSQAVSNAEAGMDSQQLANLPEIQAAVDLGVVVQGDTVRYAQWIKNRTDHEIRVKKIDVSCDCLGVELSQKQIVPQGRVLAIFSYDGRKDPEFTGNLAIVVELVGADRKRVGEITASIDVVENPPDEQVGWIR